jgi:hypothetical protein
MYKILEINMSIIFLRHRIAAGSGIGVSVYIFIQNITQKGNNVVTLNWLGTDYTFTFPDGYYSVT